MEYARLHILVTKEQHRWLSRQHHRNGESIAAVVRGLISEAMDKRNSSKKKRVRKQDNPEIDEELEDLEVPDDDRTAKIKAIRQATGISPDQYHTKS